MGKSPQRNSMLRRCLLGCAATALLALAPAAPAQQILPPGFFAQVPAGTAGQMTVSANTMVFNSITDTVTARGNVGIDFRGYRATADRAIYYQRTGRVELVGNVAFIDPDGVEYIADRIELEDEFRQGFLEAMTVAFPDGTYFTAAQTSFVQGLERIYTEGVYAPCGPCIGTHGGPIGWKVRAARIITDEVDNTIYFDQPTLELLGVPVLRLPWLSVPADEDIEFPLISIDDAYGYGLSVPLYRRHIAGGDLSLTPSLYSRQGLHLMTRWRQQIGDLDYRISASGLYQLDPDAYTGLARRELRGAVQTRGTYRATDEWTLGWTGTLFTDPGYLPHYRIDTSSFARNQVHATYLDTDSFADIRVEQFVPLGNQPDWDAFEAASNQQALTHPNARFEHVADLDEMGRIALSGRLLGLSRAGDHVHAPTGFVRGYEGQAVHGMIEAGWSNQWIAPGGLAITPHLGLRADAAGYDGASTLTSAPAEQMLFGVTPIAALDVRYPLMARTAGATHVIEPVAQLVWRGGDTRTGVVNNDSQGGVFDTSSLFSFNRFSGVDRQETGLRANLGVALQSSFDNGAWIAASVGQSHHLAGPNAFGIGDGSPAGLGLGLETPASPIVASLEGALNPYLRGGGQMRYDPGTGTIAAANVRATAEFERFIISGTYAWADANPALGVTSQRHDVEAKVTIPIMDYWSVKAGTSYDLVNDQLLTTTASLEYDDRFLAFGVGTQFTGPVQNWGDSFRIEVLFRLRTAGQREVVDFGYSWDAVD